MSNSYNRAEKNGAWVGDKVRYGSLHAWVRRNKEITSLCESCRVKPPLDLANVRNSYNPRTYTRDFGNWLWLCRSCHMKQDGRINNLKQGGKMKYYDSCILCDKPHKARSLCRLHYQQIRRFGVAYL